MLQSSELVLVEQLVTVNTLETMRSWLHIATEPRGTVCVESEVGEKTHIPQAQLLWGPRRSRPGCSSSEKQGQSGDLPVGMLSSHHCLRVQSLN
jgi:hypothetical protein